MKIYSLLLLTWCVCCSYVLSSKIPVIEIPVHPLSLEQVSHLEREYAAGNNNKEILPWNSAPEKRICGTNALKIKKELLDMQTNVAVCSNIVTQCDNPSTRNLYNNFTQQTTFELEFFIENNGNALATNANSRVSALLTKINQDYSSAGMVFTARIYLWGPLLSGGATWYTNEGCDSSMSQPCYYYISVLNSIVPNLPTPRTNWKKKKAIQIFVANIQTDSSGLTTLGFANFPFMTNSKALVMIPDTIISTDKTLQHEMGHTFGLWHTHNGVDEVNSCSDLCYESTATDYNGDLCADTPPYPNVVNVASGIVFPTCRAPTVREAPDTCVSRTSWSAIGSKNIMSYVNNDCMLEFTDCQKKRMKCVAERLLSQDESPIVGPSAGTAIMPTLVLFVFIVIIWV